MARLVLQQFVSADGFAADADGQFTLFDRVEGDPTEFDRANQRWLDSVGLILLGATTYAEFVRYWPTPAAQQEVVAERINALPKVVFSRSLTEAPWGGYEPARIVSGDAGPVVAELKAVVSGDIVVWGSLSLAAQLLTAGAVDTIRLVVLPITLGAGRGTFPTEPLSLRPTAVRLLGSLVEVEYAVLPPA
jgi:dihydrofolate reductase